MTDEIHSCSYYCDRPACIKAQRDELVRKYVEAQAEWPSDEDVRKALDVFESTLSDDHSSMRAALQSVRPPVGVVSDEFRVECRRCDVCDHIGLNDQSETQGACHNCDWTGPEQTEDKCPECGHENCMAAACPECGGRYCLVTELASRHAPTKD